MTTKTKEELEATASALGKDVKEIASLIASLTRDLLPRRAGLSMSMLTMFPSIRRRRGEGGEGLDEEFDNDRDNYINYDDYDDASNHIPTIE